MTRAVLQSAGLKGLSPAGVSGFWCFGGIDLKCCNMLNFKPISIIFDVLESSHFVLYFKDFRV